MVNQIIKRADVTTAIQIDTMARTMWAECRSGGRLGMQGVGGVIVNRAKMPPGYWWGTGLHGVCVQPWQFSCWNAGDPNLPKLQAVTAADPEFAIALDLAAQAVAGTLIDLTNGADSYYARSMISPPSWAKTGVRTYQDDWHNFYRTEVSKPADV